MIYALIFAFGCTVGLAFGFVAGLIAESWRDRSAPVADAPTDVPSDQFPVLDPYRDYPTLPMGTHTGE